MKTQTKTKSFRQRGVKLCAAFLLVILLAACGTQGEAADKDGREGLLFL